MDNPLRLYRASAGSGKTFTLAVEYVKLLIIDQREYRHILAVTFTNKATAEMKERILSTLYGLANSLEGTEGYMEAIRTSDEIRALQISDREIRRRAGIALENLAHDYSRFHIETIDSFFISVIKDLARELDLTANLNIDLNATDVLAEAVDNIIDGLQEGSPVFRNIKDFIQEKIDAESNWKIDAEVKAFGLNIFNEHYLSKSHRIAAKIQDERFMKAYRGQLWKAKADALHALQLSGQAFLGSCEAHGYGADDFKQKQRGVWGFFQTLAAGRELPEPNSYVQKCLDGPDQWCAKNPPLRQLVEGELLPLLQDTVDKLPEARRTVASVNAIARHISHLQLLSTISTQVDRLNTEANRFLLANSAHFLQRMIDKSSVPFIYEKSGNRFTHIMIDEFQDTSALQWSNFLPLLSNSLDAGQTCLIVGDVKQSIYRFRGGDWQILNTLGTVPELQGKIQERKLDYNRRSLGHIIDFNNEFFRLATAALNDDYRDAHGGEDSVQLVRAYSDVHQQQLEKKRGKGYVRIDQLAPPEAEGGEAGDGNGADYDYEAETLDLLLRHVQSLLARGIRQRDITILLRVNRHIPLISNYFAQHAGDIRLVSDEAFQLKASVSVNIIITALRYLADADDKYALVQLVSHYRRLALQSAGEGCCDTSEGNRDTSEGNRDTGEGGCDTSQLLLTDTDSLLDMLPPAFAENRHRLVFEPLKELVEHIYVLFRLELIPRQDAYLFYFHDQLAAYTEDKRADINSFLSYWDEKLSVKTIPNSIDDGVRIMSIHKSKGLEFHTVIIPFCDWKTTGKPTELLWCEPHGKPYDELPLTPVNFNDDMRNSILADDYENEVLLNNVDNLNLLYVAFTRAVCNLFIITEAPRPPKGKSKAKEGRADGGNPVKDVRQLIAKSMPAFMQQGDAWEYGTLATAPEEKSIDTDNVLTRPYQKTPITFHTSDTLPEFRQSNKSKDFIADHASADTGEATDSGSQAGTTDSGSQAGTGSRGYIDRGLLYHAIFQEVNTLDDIDRIVEKMNMQGHFRSLAERDEVSRHIHRAFSDPFAARWFSGDWQVVNERTILYPDQGGTEWRQMRADRVILSDNETIVIDYKTGRYNKEHEDQVRLYMDKLSQMGYPGVKGYVWYIMTGKTHKVEL